MTDRDLVHKLEKVPLFAACSKRELAAVANAAKPRTFKSGTVIAREGDPGVGLFVILDGTAEVTAATDVRVAALTEWTFRGLLQQHPSISIKTLEVMAGRIRKAEKSADV